MSVEYKDIVTRGNPFEESGGLSPENTGEQNATALQEALNDNIPIVITTPGVYNIGAGPETDSNAKIYLPPITNIYLGAGVTLLNDISVLGSMFINRNWKSNKVALVSAAYAYDTNVLGAGATGTTTATFNTGTVAHGLVVGDTAYIKNDTAEQINGFYEVLAIDNTDTNNRKFKVHMYGFNGAAPVGAFAGTPIIYKADASIIVEGDGVIDYNTTAGSPLQLMGAILNKVANIRWTIKTKNAIKYGCYIGNSGHSVVSMPMAESPSNSVQFIGPAQNIIVEEIGGSASDDPFAVTTSNVGFTELDLKDADTTVNSNGPVKSIHIKHSAPNKQKTRGILLAGSAAGGIDATIDSIYAYANAKTPALRLDTVSGEATTVVCNIGSVIAEMDTTTFGPIAVGSNYPATMTAKVNIGSITGRAKAGTNGARQYLVYMNQSNINSTLNIGNLHHDVDLGAGSSFGAIECIGAGGNYNINVGNLTVNSVGTAIVHRAIRLNNTGAASYAHIGSYSGIGPNIGAFACLVLDGHSVSVDSYQDLTTSGSNTFLLESDRSCKLQVGNYVCRGSSAKGLFNLYPGSAKTVEVSVGNVNSVSGASLGNLNSANLTLKLSIASGNANNNTFTKNASAVLQLGGNVIMNNFTLDGATLDATVGNHAPGASFYNNNAAFGIGVGAYVRGSATWSRVAI